MLKKLVRSTVIMGLLAGIAGAGAYFAITHFITHEGPVRVPDLRGKDIVAVLQTLTDLDLNTKIQALEPSTTHAKNQVIGQDPPPGAEIKKGREVRIIISQGPQTMVTPNLLGLALEEAHAILVSQDICRGNVAQTREQDGGLNEVLAQNPNPGMVISREECVDLLVNVGKTNQLYLMPDFTGQVLSTSLARMAQLDLRSQTISYAYDPQQSSNIVLNQTPGPGTPIHSRQSVTFVVNGLPDGLSAPSATAPTASHLIRHRLAPGFLKQRIRVHWRTATLKEDLFDDFVAPGEEVWVLIPRHLNAVVELFESEIKTESRQWHVPNTH